MMYFRRKNRSPVNGADRERHIGINSLTRRERLVLTHIYVVEVGGVQH